ncbi:Transforming growth factor-beta receptor-associated protein 1 [Lamellibrachia satsuma]|nr:Transforming growth factor-beta receptor-associated protein 1 [Lamellibrachia satsuma]
MSIKAFELVPALERLKLGSDKSLLQIHCIECWGTNIYLGTDDCFIFHYILEEKVKNGSVTFHCEKCSHRHLSAKKPILQLKAVSALDRMLVLCDGIVSLLHLSTLEPISGATRIKNVALFSLNENPLESSPFSVEIVVALRKKNVLIYTVTDDKMILKKEIGTTEPALALAADGAHVCVALQSQYKIGNFETGHVQELFPYDREHVNPIVTRISQEEFLLSAPGALGMFTAASGISQRPPLQWSGNLTSVVCTHPYILALNDEFITVHSILDQQQKQTLSFLGGRCLGEFDGRLVVTTASDVYILVPVAIEKQIGALLADYRVSEALNLAQNARKTGLTKEQFLKMFRQIQLKAAFIEFSRLQFDEASRLFHEGKPDVRELISLYPRLIPGSSDFIRSIPPLHEIADINQLARGDQGKVQEFKDFLLRHLEGVRGTPRGTAYALEVDTALLKLYAETGSSQLLNLVSSDNACDITECVACLEKHARHHALALWYSHRGNHEMGLRIWSRIVDGEYTDASFPGLMFIRDVLARLTDVDLLWTYVDWILERNEVEGVKIFMQRPEKETESDRMKPENIVDYISRFPKALVAYLEYLIFTRKSQKETFHTHLALLYIDNVTGHLKGTNRDQLDGARAKLCCLLRESDQCQVHLLLGKIRDTELYPECAILYGKLAEHEKALDILVTKLNDFGAAENYCITASQGRDIACRKHLFQTLLGIYLRPDNETSSLTSAAIALLNNNRADFDTEKVLQLLPDNWSMGLISQFLSSSIRKTINGSRMSRVEHMLARGAYLQAKQESIECFSNAVSLTDDSSCAVCGKGFTEPAFARYPNGVVTHIACAKNKTVCPVTGKLFRTASVAKATHK